MRGQATAQAPQEPTAAPATPAPQQPMPQPTVRSGVVFGDDGTGRAATPAQFGG